MIPSSTPAATPTPTPKPQPIQATPSPQAVPSLPPGPSQPQPPQADAAPVDDSDKTLLDLEKEYQTTKDASRREELLGLIEATSDPEVFDVYSRLMLTEKDPNLLLLMLNTYPALDGNMKVRMAVYTVLVGATQKPDVREAAMTALEQVQELPAVAVWQLLTMDGNPEIRERAKSAIETIRALQQ